MFSLLFVGTGDTDLSLMTKGLAKSILDTTAFENKDCINILSAELKANGYVHPLVVKVMLEEKVDVGGQQLECLNYQNLLTVDMVITVGKALDAKDLVLPLGVRRLHWQLHSSPATGDDQLLVQLRTNRDIIKLKLALLFDELNHEITQHQLISSVFNSSNVNILKNEMCYKGFFEIQQLTLKHSLYAGGESNSFSRELFVRGPAVVVLLYDPQRDEVVLIEQFRVGALNSNENPWLWELVAGLVDTDETVADVARREALEEAGCEILDLIPVYEYLASPGGSNEVITIMCGRVNSEIVGGIFGLEHENEDIRAQVVAMSVAVSAVKTGKINNAATIMAIQWLQLNHNWLKSYWC